MSRKTNLSTQTGKIWLIIRKNRVLDKDKIDEFLNLYCNEYAWICHEHDINSDGQVEGVHYHFVFNLKGDYRKQRLHTTLGRICNHFGFKDNSGVQIEKYDSFEGCIQYLTHKNQPSKTQHKVEEIVTNIPKDTFNLYYNLDLNDVFSFEFVFSACISHNNKLEVVKELWNWYSKNATYKRCIDEIWELTREKRLRS